MSYRLLAKKVVGFVALNTASTNITTSAYVQLVAALSGTIEAIQYCNNTTSTLYLAVGASGHETNQLILGPGEGGMILPTESLFPSGARLSITAFDATASAGVVSINFLGG